MVAKPLNQQSLMPQMSVAFAGWGSNITLGIIIDKIIDGFVKEIINTTQFTGTIQPLRPKEIQQYPEGQWAFQWLQIHCYNNTLVLNTNDRIIYNGKRFKIMGQLDYSLNNYVEYHAVADFQGNVK